MVTKHVVQLNGSTIKTYEGDEFDENKMNVRHDRVQPARMMEGGESLK